ncbi:AraC family transcriptional regulator [Nocardia mangyaensis]|uniref:AraC family transcriptional regulator n=1 Tax=Nocardia mangyaensis TaxID=2213200 RepID=UPI0026752D85|nr:helix-turn-helix domain-containing protein [Nocardia mangyaensis]MDO3647564.1 helix-turn-helix domain-containing protein [Nocardia mangyaensis]
MSTRYLTPAEIETPVPAPGALRRWLTELTSTEAIDDLDRPFAQPPVARTTIVLRTDQAGRRAALVVGAQTKAVYSRPEEPADCVRLRLAPGVTRRLLGVAAVELTDRAVRLAELPGPLATFAGDLTHLPDDEALAYLEDVLPQRVSETDTDRAHRTVLREAISVLTADNAPAIPALATRLAVSERQLRNLFTTGIGVSPKHFVRIDRVRRVLAYAGNTPWSDLAADTGYYDQSHLTADFRSLMGVAPAAWLRGQLPAPRRCRMPH